MHSLAAIPLEDLLAELRRRRQLLDAAEAQTADPQPWLPIIHAVAQAFVIPTASLWSEDRRIATTQARQAAMILMRTHLDMTLQAIGAVFRRDHGTVIHALRTQESRMLYPKYRRAFESAESSLASRVSTSRVSPP